MTTMNNEFLTRIESLGDNCELGFVLRNSKYEKGSLFRWTITPIDRLIEFLENPDIDLFSIDNLVPFSPGMVLDKRTGFSFHSKMRSEKDGNGQLNYIDDEADRRNIYENEKQKIEYLKTGFLNRLNAPIGSIFLVKANKGISESQIVKLASLLFTYSSKHVLVEVREGDIEDTHNLIVDQGTHYTANVNKLAPYVAANDIAYDDWNNIISALMNHLQINTRIGTQSKVA